jgi:hypothetical protein
LSKKKKNRNLIEQNSGITENKSVNSIDDSEGLATEEESTTEITENSVVSQDHQPQENKESTDGKKEDVSEALPEDISNELKDMADKLLSDESLDAMTSGMGIPKEFLKAPSDHDNLKAAIDASIKYETGFTPEQIKAITEAMDSGTATQVHKENESTYISRKVMDELREKIDSNKKRAQEEKEFNIAAKAREGAEQLEKHYGIPADEVSDIDALNEGTEAIENLRSEMLKQAVAETEAEIRNELGIDDIDNNMGEDVVMAMKKKAAEDIGDPKNQQEPKPTVTTYNELKNSQGTGVPMVGKETKVGEEGELVAEEPLSGEKELSVIIVLLGERDTENSLVKKFARLKKTAPSLKYIKRTEDGVDKIIFGPFADSKAIRLGMKAIQGAGFIGTVHSCTVEIYEALISE